MVTDELPADAVTAPPDATTTALFLAAATLGAGNVLAVRVTVRELAPFWGGGMRFAVAAAAFVVLVAALRLDWPRGPALRLTVVYGLLNFGAFYALGYWALVRTTAGAAAIVLATVPLVTLGLATAQRSEPFRLRGLVGTLLALVGVGYLAVDPDRTIVPPEALVAVMLAAVCAGQSIIVGKRLSGHHPAAINAVGMSVGAAALLALSAVAGEAWVLPRQPEVVGAIGYVVTLGSVGLFVLVLLVVRRWTASATSYIFVLMPVLTLGLAAWLLDEPVTLRAAIGTTLVIAGVWSGALSPRARAVAVR